MPPKTNKKRPAPNPAAQPPGKKPKPNPTSPKALPGSNTGQPAPKPPEKTFVSGLPVYRPAPKPPAPPVVQPAPASPKRAQPKKVLQAIITPPKEVLELFVCGKNEKSQLALDTTDDSTVLIPVWNPRSSLDFVEIALGIHHGVGLTSDNRLLTWGSGDQGQMGRFNPPSVGSSTVLRDNEPKEMKVDALLDAEGYPIKPEWAQVGATETGTFALSTTGQLYGCGEFNLYARVDGQPPLSDVPQGFWPPEDPAAKPGPRWFMGHIPMDKNVKLVKIVCGLQHVVGLASGGKKVYTFGINDHFQLGRRCMRPREEFKHSPGLKPRPASFVPPLREATLIGAGSYHSYAVSHATKRVLGWGMNSDGQAGVNDNNDPWGSTIEFPKEAKYLSGSNYQPVTHISGTYSNGLVIRGNKLQKAYVWGKAEHGSLGLPRSALKTADMNRSKQLLLTPQPLGHMTVEAGATGKWGGMVIAKRSRPQKSTVLSVYSWGSNEPTGQGTGTGLPDRYIHRFTLLEKPAVLKRSNAHVVIVGNHSAFIGLKRDQALGTAKTSLDSMDAMDSDDDDDGLLSADAKADRDERIRFKQMTARERDSQNNINKLGEQT
ncbi:MAG: hypothetical protein M1814_001173 [Vezdaea aestivalis]|nr:MAG: hypothetical protein M1814_001173 [Vezdaea aestivalis]